MKFKTNEQLVEYVKSQLEDIQKNHGNLETEFSFDEILDMIHEALDTNVDLTISEINQNQKIIQAEKKKEKERKDN